METRTLLTKLEDRVKELREEGRSEPLLLAAASAIKRLEALADEWERREYKARNGRDPPDMFGN